MPTASTARTASRPLLSARSVVLSLLLGARPPRLAARDLTRLGERFAITPATLRVALSRMTAAGDLVADGAVYGLTERHLRRQAATDALLRPARRRYDGRWSQVVVVDRGRPAGERADLRARLAETRHAELREGVWMRPDNLEGVAPTAPGLEVFTVLPPDAPALTRTLWDLEGWVAEGRDLLDELASDAPARERLAAAAAAVRHLCRDPALPDELAPPDWPADALRRAYDDYRAELTALLQEDDT